MLVNLYSCADDVRRYRKNLTLIAEGINAKPTQPCSVLQPTLILNNTANYINSNYVYIPAWSRYYFCTATLLTGAEIQLQCDVDVLMSYDLTECDTMVIRSEQAGINYIPDKQLPVDPSRSNLHGILFPQQPFFIDRELSGGENLRYLLIVNAGRSAFNG